MMEFTAELGKVNRWQEKERSWKHVVQERTIMQFLALRKPACNHYWETSCIVTENEWERSSLWPWVRLVYHHGKASSTFSEENVRFLWPTQDEAILSMRIAGMQLNLNHLPDDTVHVWWFGENFGILELDAMFSVEHVLCQCQLIRLC